MPRENTIQSTHSSKGTNFTYAIFFSGISSGAPQVDINSPMIMLTSLRCKHRTASAVIVVLQDVRHQCVYRACYAHSCRCHCRCQWGVAVEQPGGEVAYGAPVPGG